MTSHSYLLSRLMMRHYWIWLAFTTTDPVSESLRYRELKHALDAMAVPT